MARTAAQVQAQRARLRAAARALPQRQPPQQRRQRRRRRRTAHEKYCSRRLHGKRGTNGRNAPRRARRHHRHRRQKQAGSGFPRQPPPVIGDWGNNFPAGVPVSMRQPYLFRAVPGAIVT